MTEIKHPNMMPVKALNDTFSISLTTNRQTKTATIGMKNSHHFNDVGESIIW